MDAPGLPEPSTRWRWALVLGVFLLVALAFWPAANNGFVNYDDPDYVTSNEHLRQGLSWAGVRWALISTQEAANWHPVTWLSHLADYEWSGLEPRGHHLTSIGLHAANSVLLFLFLAGTTSFWWRSLAVALLVGLHPLRVESVAWVAERKDLLCALFFWLSLLAYSRHVRLSTRFATPSVGQGFRGWWSGLYVVSLAAFALGLMSKPMLVTLPFVLLLLDIWPLRRWQAGNVGRLVLEKVPFFVLAAAMIVVTLRVQTASGAVQANRAWGMRWQTTMVSYGTYLQDLLWPAGLCVHYPYPAAWPVARVLADSAVVIGVTVLVFRRRRSHPQWLTGWLWYLGMLVPVIGLVPVGLQARADRYTYLPSVGVVIMVVWGVSEWAANGKRKQWILGLGLGLASVGCIAVTRNQIAWWQDSGTLFERALSVTRENNVACARLGEHLRQQGKMTEAMAMYREAIRIDPAMEEPQLNLGILLCMNGRREEGITQLRTALRSIPRSALIHGNLGLFLTGNGALAEAEEHLNAALALKPNYPEAHVALGDVWLKQGRTEAATKQYREALRWRPGFPVAQRRLQALGLN